MDAVDILKICFRRWYVMLPFLLGAAGVSYQLVQAQETTYTAHTSYGLVQPGLTTTSGQTAERNPLGAFDSDLVGAALEAQLNSRVSQRQLGSEDTQGWGPGEANDGSSYTVGIPQFETTYEVRAWGKDQREVQRVVDRVVEAAPDIADDLQSRVGAPESVRYQPFVLAPTEVEALPSTSAMKIGIAVMGVGVLVGAAWSVVADRLLRRRRTAGGPSAPREPVATGPADPPHDTAAPRPASSDAPPPAPTSKGGELPRVTRAEGSGAASGEMGEPGKPGGGRSDRRHQPLVRR